MIKMPRVKGKTLDKKEVRHLINLGLSDRQIASKLGVNPNAIYYWRKKFKLPSPREAMERYERFKQIFQKFRDHKSEKFPEEGDLALFLFEILDHENQEFLDKEFPD